MSSSRKEENGCWCLKQHGPLVRASILVCFIFKSACLSFTVHDDHCSAAKQTDGDFDDLKGNLTDPKLGPTMDVKRILLYK